MNSRLRILATVFALFTTASSLAGCSFEPGERTQLVGQECFLDGDCVEGALCVERRCRYEASARTSDAGAGATNDTDDASSPDVPDVEIGDVPDFRDVAVGEDDAQQQVCGPSTTRCISDTEFEICRNDGSGYNTRTCQDGLRCQRAECVPVDLSTCEFQDQPCNQEGPNNGFQCVDLSGDGNQMRCLGICDTTVDDPDATCPEPGSGCTFDDQQGSGVCLTGCTIEEGCSLAEFGCLPVDSQQSEGFCVPTNPANQVGDQCDSDDFFDCEEGAMCIDIQNGARCVEACRAFSGGAGTDCANGHCVPLTDSLGMCRRDAGNLAEGDQCRRGQLFQACGEDAVVCTPRGGWQSPQCIGFCRLDEGNADCSGQQVCTQYDEQREDLGVCVNSMP